MTIEWIHPDELRNHPTNISIYGDAPDPELLASVKAHGVFPDHPIGYVMEGDFRVIVSGHRRNQAAKIAKLDMVPVVRLTELEGDPLAIKERIILSNKQRIKTAEQKAREAALLIDIESERAKARQNLGVNLPEGSKGRASEKIADSLGVSEKTARSLIVAGKALEDAEKKGQTKKAAKIKKGLERSAAAGAKAAKPEKLPKNGSVVAPPYDEKRLDKPLGVVRRELDTRLEAYPQTEKLFRAAKYALSQFQDALNNWRGK